MFTSKSSRKYSYANSYIFAMTHITQCKMIISQLEQDLLPLIC